LGIDVDNEAAFWLSTRKCIDAGHREIALLNGPEPYSYARQRELGYRKALRQSGIQLDTELILNGEPTFAMGSVMASYLLRSMQRPTALVCATDELALGAMSACTDLGLRVGRDISVVGYGDTEQARKSTPRLATLIFSLRGISQQLADSLLSQLEPQRFNRVNSICVNRRALIWLRRRAT
jgi:LacI family transcriptional regulator